MINKSNPSNTNHVPIKKGGVFMRNKAKGFPNRMSFNGEPFAKEEYSSKRPDGSTRDHPQERMRQSTEDRRHR